MSPSICLIAALDHRGAIGVDNALPWHLPDDLKRFKALTLGKPLLMGRKTAESLGRALPGRLNLVLSRTVAVPFAGMQRVASVDEALQHCADAPELWVIGGGEVYSLCLARAQRLYLTHVEVELARVDAWFPALDSDAWQVERREAHAADARHALGFEFVDYRRRPAAG